MRLTTLSLTQTRPSQVTCGCVKLRLETSQDHVSEMPRDRLEIIRDRIEITRDHSRPLEITRDYSRSSRLSSSISLKSPNSLPHSSSTLMRWGGGGLG